MATDRDGNTISDGDDIVVIGKRRGAAGTGRSLVVVGERPLVVQDAEILKASAIGSGGGAPFAVWFSCDQTTVVGTNLASGDRWFPRTNESFVCRIPCDAYTEVRLFVMVYTAGSSGSVADLVYRTTWSDAHADYADIAASGHVRCALDTVGVADSGWVAIAAGAQVDPVYVGLRSSGGDDTTDPAFGRIYALFR